MINIPEQFTLGTSLELSGIELRYIVGQITNKVANSGYYVSAVNAVTRNSILLRFHHPTQEDVLLVLSSKGLWITKLKFKPIEENNPIENSVRSEIERAKLESLEQMGSERIVSIAFRRLDGTVRIIVAEFFGEGNIIICDETMQILSILHRIEVRHRTLGVGLRYAAPPTRGVNVFQLSLEQLKSLQDEGKNLDVLRWVGRGISMPKRFVEEIIFRAQVDPTKKTGDLTEDELTKIYESIRSLVTEISTGQNNNPIVIVTKDPGNAERPVDALPIITQEASKLTYKQVPSFMEAVDEVLSAEILDVSRSSKTVEIDKQIALLEHDLNEQDKAKDALAEKSSQIRKLASELMAISYSNADTSGETIEEALSRYSAQITIEKGRKYIEILGEQVPHESNLAKTSSMLFARAKELERGSASIDQSRSKLIEQISKLHDKTKAIHKKINVQEQTAKEWYERYRWFITTDGLMAIGGRDASSNSALIRKHLTENDIVFHAEVHGSPFFIVKNAAEVAMTGSIEPSLVQAAQATVGFSRAWKDGLSSADAYWVTPGQIKKGAPTGQFLPKGSFVIEGKRNYLKSVEIRLAIGLVELEGRLVIVCGPETAIKPRAVYYAVLQQSGLDPMNAAKKIKADFVSLANSDTKQESIQENAAESVVDRIKRISLDDFVRSLPTGQSRVVFAARGQKMVSTTKIASDHKK